MPDEKARGVPMTRDRLNRYPRLVREARWLTEQERHLSRVTDQVKGSLPEFPYTQHTFHISGTDPGEQRAIRGRIERLHAEMKRVERFVAGIEDGLLQASFQLHYLKGKTWVQTAAALYATSDSVRKACERYMDKVEDGEI